MSTAKFRKKNRPNGSPPKIDVVEMRCSDGLASPCHVFQGTINKLSGYGVIGIGKKTFYVHRYVWEKVVGPIADGMVIDHVCRNRACCNVEHLRVVTRGQNAKENVVGSGWQINAQKTNCKQGHPFSLENTYRTKAGHRACRTCRRVWIRRHKSARIRKA